MGRIKFLLGILILCELGYADIKGDTFSEPKTGFRISKPKDWEFVRDPKTFGIELKNGFTEKENGLIVTFSKKSKKAAAGVRPSVGVTRLSVAPKTTLVEWLERELESQKEHDRYFVPASNAIATKMEGDRSAARAAFINSTVIDGRDVHVYHVVYVVHSGGQVYMINMNCNEDESNEYVGTFGEIAGSIEVNQPAK